MKSCIRCDWCGKEFAKKKSKMTEHNYCSRSCLGKANGERNSKVIFRTCDNCGKTYRSNNKHRSRNKHFFCCPECGWEFKNKKVEVICDWCGKPFMKKRSDVDRTDHNFCCVGCRMDFINMEKPQAYNQRIAGQTLYRYLAEQKVGRKLDSSEEVHHIDGNHMNNSPDNLEIVSKSEHSSIHAGRKERDVHGRFIKS